MSQHAPIVEGGPQNCRPAHLGRPRNYPVPQYQVAALERTAAFFRAHAPTFERLARMQAPPPAPPITPAMLHPLPGLAEFLEMPPDVQDALRAEIVRGIASDRKD